MSYRIYFGFTQGINRTIKVPIGTKQQLESHIEEVESTLNIKREKYLDNPERWGHNNYDDVPDKVLCNIAEKHNAYVRGFYETIEEFQHSTNKELEDITPEEFETYLPALTFITVLPQRWTGEYYTARMEVLYEVMRGRECEGVTFNAAKLTEKQAAAVVILFSEFLDIEDRRLDVPKGHDYLASSYNGGYDWCEKCGAITWDDAQRCNRKVCPLRENQENED